MKVLVAGATGALGRALLPMLAAAGHEPVGLARHLPAVAEPGVRHVVADALDPHALTVAVVAVAPEAVVNLLTAIPAEISPRRMRRQFAPTNRLRTEGTANLLAAAQDAGARQHLCEGVAFAYDPAPGRAVETDPWWADPPREFAGVLAALRRQEELVVAAGGTVLRFGHLTGPGTAFAADGSFVRQVRARRFPLVGDGGAEFSFIRTTDAAAAVVAALGRPLPAALNVVEDDPVPVRIWLPALAAALGAPPPRTVPLRVARLVAGGWGAAFLTRLRAADNACAREELGWAPSPPDWDRGFRTAAPAS